MAYFPDLAPFTGLRGRDLIAVGWLRKGTPFPVSRRPDEDLADGLTLARFGEVRLRANRREQRCELCGRRDVARFGRGELFVVGGDRVFVAPALLGHYVRSHRYRPPAAFVRALREAPTVGRPEFRAALVRHGLIAQPATDRYEAADIEVLEGLEAVRRRPGMYVGDTGHRGKSHVVYELLGNAFDQVLAGHATKVRLDIRRSGWVELEDDGRGIPIGLTRVGLSFLEVAFTRLHFGATLDGHTPHVHVGPDLFGVGAAVVNALCARLELETRVDGSAWAIVFSAGRTVEPLRRVGPTSKRGTLIRFKLDSEIFGDTRLDTGGIQLRLVELAHFMPTLKLVFQGRSLSRPEGLEGLLHAQVAGIVPRSVLVGRGNVDGIGVEFAIGWSPELEAAVINSYVNMGPTTEGGTHVASFIAAIEATTGDEALRTAARAGLCGVVHVSMLAPEFGGPTKSRLSSANAGPVVERVVREVVSQSPWFWDAIHSAVR
ncbi:MAG: ATP-binding protein [Archangium sp.]